MFIYMYFYVLQNFLCWLYPVSFIQRDPVDMLFHGLESQRVTDIVYFI